MSARVFANRRMRPFRRAHAGYIGIGNRRGIGGGQTWAQRIAALLNGSEFYAPLTHSLVLERGTGDPTYTNATGNRSFTDWEGVLRTAIAGEARFTGARRVRNLVAASERWNNWTASNSAVIDSATQATIAAVANSAIQMPIVSAPTKAVFRWTIKLACSAGSENITLRTVDGSDGSDSTNTTLALTTTPTVFTGLADMSGSSTFSGNLTILLGNLGSSGVTNTAKTILLSYIQLEDVTGQSVQTAAEYVSVGGVPTPVENNYLRLPGVNGNFTSTPNALANRITGTIDFDAEVALDDYTPPSAYKILAKLNASAGAGQWCYDFTVNTTTGLLSARFSHDGSTLTTFTSSVAPAATDGTLIYLRAVIVPTNGANSVCTFYTSPDGVTWTQLGTQQTSTARASIFAGSDALGIGGYPTDGTTPLQGKVYRARIYNGDRDAGGSLAVDFDPTRYTGSYNGATMTAATGEVWTLNSTAPTTLSGARITSDANFAFGYPNHGGGGVDGIAFFNTDRSGALLSPQPAYLAEGARTNLVWPSEDLTSVRYVSGGGGIAVVADQAVAPDGTTTADQLTASGANGTLIQDLGVIASTAQCFSLYLKRKTGTGNIDITLDGGATWTTQTINSTTWTRCEITQTLANPDVGIRIVTSGDAIYAWGLQCE